MGFSDGIAIFFGFTTVLASGLAWHYWIRSTQAAEKSLELQESALANDFLSKKKLLLNEINSLIRQIRTSKSSEVTYVEHFKKINELTNLSDSENYRIVLSQHNDIIEYSERMIACFEKFYKEVKDITHFKDMSKLESISHDVDDTAGIYKTYEDNTADLKSNVAENLNKAINLKNRLKAE